MKIKNRIKSHQEFQSTIKNGKSIRNDSFIVYFLKNEYGYPRVGISIPTKSGHAVTRNKMKRQIRAILSHELNLNLGFDLIFITRRSYDINNFSKTSQDIVMLLNKVGN